MVRAPMLWSTSSRCELPGGGEPGARGMRRGSGVSAKFVPVNESVCAPGSAGSGSGSRRGPGGAGRPRAPRGATAPRGAGGATWSQSSAPDRNSLIARRSFFFFALSTLGEAFAAFFSAAARSPRAVLAFPAAASQRAEGAIVRKVLFRPASGDAAALRWAGWAACGPGRGRSRRQRGAEGQRRRRGGTGHEDDGDNAAHDPPRRPYRSAPKTQPGRVRTLPPWPASP